MHFTKMHGLGNDYLYVYGNPADFSVDPSALSIRLSNRHFGAGSDGMIWIFPSAVADFRMRIFNADGSEAKMCGNGIRCVGKYVYDKGYTDKTHLTVETLSGIRSLDLHLADGKVTAATVDMGKATVFPDLPLTVDQHTFPITPVSVGNPHAVLFTEDPDTALTALGSKIERHPAFPDGTNVEFIRVLSPTELRMRVWERGSGITMACGTGACASVAASARKNLCSRNTPITVHLDGGTLIVRIDNQDSLLMTGPAETVYEGEIPL